MRIKGRLTALEQFFASAPPIRLLKSDGRVEEIRPSANEDQLDFLSRLADSPLSREAELICHAVAILDQPGHQIEFVKGMLEHRRDVLRGKITPEPVELALCTREQYCGMEPQSADDLAARLKLVYGE
jgi:hypothetical protein